MNYSKPKNSKFKKIKLKHFYPDNLSTHFVSNVVVQHQKEFFTLSFFEVWVPPILGETVEEKMTEINEISHVDAKCVSRLVITPEKMREFLKILKENIDNYDKTFSKR